MGRQRGLVGTRDVFAEIDCSVGDCNDETCMDVWIMRDKRVDKKDWFV